MHPQFVKSLIEDLALEDTEIGHLTLAFIHKLSSDVQDKEKSKTYFEKLLSNKLEFFQICAHYQLADFLEDDIYLAKQHYDFINPDNPLTTVQGHLKIANFYSHIKTVETKEKMRAHLDAAKTGLGSKTSDLLQTLEDQYAMQEEPICISKKMIQLIDNLQHVLHQLIILHEQPAKEQRSNGSGF